MHCPALCGGRDATTLAAGAAAHFGRRAALCRLAALAWFAARALDGVGEAVDDRSQAVSSVGSSRASAVTRLEQLVLAVSRCSPIAKALCCSCLAP